MLQSALSYDEYDPTDPNTALRPPVPAAQSTAALRPPSVLPALTPVPSAPKPIQPAQNDPISAYLQAARAHESAGNDQVVNKSTGATGRYQFLPSTWNGLIRQHPELGLKPEDIYDGDKQDVAMRAFTADNAAVLEQHGFPPSPRNLFMLSFLGPGAGPRFLKDMTANPDAAAAAMFPNEAKYNAGVFYQTDPHGQPIYDRPRSLSQVYQFMTHTFGGDAPIDVSRTGAPPNARLAQGPSTVATDAVAGPPQVADAVTLEMPPEVRKAFGLPPLERNVAPPARIMPPEVRKAFGLPDEPTPGDNPYAIPAEQKPPAEGGEVIGIDPLGGPIFKDQKDQEEFMRGENQFSKGLLAGVPRDITGPASMLPNWLGGGYAQEATNYLNTVGDETGRTIGGMLPFLFPGAGLFRAGKALVEEAPEAATALDRLGQWTRTLGKGAGTGAVGGAGIGTQDSSDETTMGGRWEEKAPSMIGYGLIGAGLGTLAPVASGAYSAAKGFAKMLTGGYAREAAEAADKLSKEAGSRAKSALAADKAMIEASQAEIEKAEREGAKAAEELRGGIDFETGKALSAEDKALREAKLAKRAEMRALDARQADLDRARESASRIVRLFAGRYRVTPEKLGEETEAAALDDMRAAKRERDVKSGFAQAVAADGGRPSIDTGEFIGELDSLQRRFAVDLSDLKSKLETISDVEGQPAASRVSIERAREFLETADNRAEDATSQVAHELQALREDFIAHLESVHPDMKTARKAYAAYSRPMDRYGKFGILKNAVKLDPYSGDNVIDTSKVLGALLNNNEAGADAIAHLVVKNPTMMESVRGFLNQRFIEAAGDNKLPTPQQFAAFMKQNRLLMERVGLDPADVESAKRMFTPSAEPPSPRATKGPREEKTGGIAASGRPTARGPGESDEDYLARIDKMRQPIKRPNGGTEYPALNLNEEEERDLDRALYQRNARFQQALRNAGAEGKGLPSSPSAPKPPESAPKPAPAESVARPEPIGGVERMPLRGYQAFSAPEKVILDRVRQVYMELTGDELNKPVSIADLRRYLPDVEPDELISVIRKMKREEAFRGDRDVGALGEGAVDAELDGKRIRNLTLKRDWRGPLHGEFKRLGADAVEARERVESGEKSVEETRKNIERIDSERKRARGSRTDYRQLKTDLEFAEPGEVPGMTEKGAAKLNSEHRISDTRYRELVKSATGAENKLAESKKTISELTSQKARAEAAHHALSTLETDLAGAKNNEEIAGASERIVKSLISRRIISQEEYAKLSDQIKDAVARNTKYETTRKVVHGLIRAAVIAGSGGIGFALERYVPHRIYLPQ